MPYICDHCDEELHLERGTGNLIGSDNTSDCSENPAGHTWEGRSVL